MEERKRTKKEYFIIFLILFAFSWIVCRCDNYGLNPPKKSMQRIITKDDKIKSQFSTWDGSHIEFTKLIKQSMNNPKSYEHVKTTYAEYDNYIIVLTQFRGTNAFGAVVTNYMKAKYSIDGKLIEIVY